MANQPLDLKPPAEKDEPAKLPLEVARQQEAALWFEEAVLFGSRARGQSDEFSDWDLFVAGRDFPANWRDRMRAVRKDKPAGVDVFAWTTEKRTSSPTWGAMRRNS